MRIKELVITVPYNLRELRSFMWLFKELKKGYKHKGGFVIDVKLLVNLSRANFKVDRLNKINDFLGQHLFRAKMMIFDGLDITGSLSSEFKDDVLGRNREKTIQGLLKILWQFPFPDRAILRVHWLESDKVEFDKDDQLIMELIARVLSAKNKAGAKLPVGRLIIGHTYQVTRLGTSAREKLLSFLTEVVLMKKKLRLEFNVNRESNRYLWNNDVPVDYQNLIRLRTKLLEKVPAGSGVTVDITEGSDGRAVLFREQHPLMSEVEHFKNKKSFLRFCQF